MFYALLLNMRYIHKWGTVLFFDIKMKPLGCERRLFLSTIILSIYKSKFFRSKGANTLRVNFIMTQPVKSLQLHMQFHCHPYTMPLFDWCNICKNLATYLLLLL